jgi:hypothetical protein
MRIGFGRTSGTVAVIFLSIVSCTREPVTVLPPLRGTMAGVKLAFPQTKVGELVLSDVIVRYEGEKDWWSSNLKEHYPLPTQDSVIDVFTIILNRATFQPIASKADVVSFGADYVRGYASDNPPWQINRWPQFAFVPDLYVQGNGQLKRLYAEQTAASTKVVGRLFPRPDEYGLRKISSDQEGGHFPEAMLTGLFDTWYFDDASWQSMIACRRTSDSKSPRMLVCKHYFVVPELRAVAVGWVIATEDVAEWQRIEGEFRRRALSYRVDAVGR